MLTQFFVQMAMRVVLFYKESNRAERLFFSDLKHGNGGNMNELKIKSTVVLSFIFNTLGILAIPVLCLLPLNIIDYITGINAAPYRDSKSGRPVKSYKSIRGINKKVSMYLLICVGWIVDKLIATSLAYIGVAINFQIFAITIACWLCFNETISILENMEDSGAAIPPFLMPLLKKIKKQINAVGESQESEDDE